MLSCLVTMTQTLRQVNMNRTCLAAIVVVAIAMPAMALAQTDLPAPNSSAPVKPGAIRITTRAPDSDKWLYSRNVNGTQRIYRCKPLACSDAEQVTFLFSRNPTAHPDPKALEKFASVGLPKSMRAVAAAQSVMSEGPTKVDTLSSKTATLNTYPAVVNETKYTRSHKIIFIQTAIIFAGPIMIRVSSVSLDRELAKTSLTSFVDAMAIVQATPAPQPQLPLSPAKPVEGTHGI